jgi:glycosidase
VPRVTSTYRLQLHAGFTFADAESVVPYLADLGVSHLYLSPVLQAATPGSASRSVAAPDWSPSPPPRGSTAWAWCWTWSPTTWPS